MDHQLTYISLFSGAGVGCYGFKLEGFECIATAENIARRLAVQQHNHVCRYLTGYISDDLTTVRAKKKIFSQLKQWQTQHNLKSVDVLIATPPCQGMSVANLKKKNELARNSLVVESIKITQAIKPRFFVFENVRAFLTTVCTDTDGIDKPIRKAIEHNLEGEYNVLYRVINFKDYGNHSSRTRTLVIGVRKDLLDVTPYDLFPDVKAEQSLKKIIGDLPPLKKMGQIDKHDIYHAFRSYPEYMLEWIKDLKEGESAFDNQDQNKQPYKHVNGQRVPNQNKNGDKYKRWYWNKVAPCIHTRNDQLASQNTIHPRDPRVFSIRELMRMMSVPESFHWSDIPQNILNGLPEDEKRLYLSKNEMNIRQCLGEAVPTSIFQSIARKIKNLSSINGLSETDINKLITLHNLDDATNLKKFVKNNLAIYSYQALSKISELANAQRLHNAAFYTRQDICFSLINDLPDEKQFTKVRILEPSVGVGNFLPLLIKKFQKVKEVVIDVVDIDPNALAVLKLLTKKLAIPSNVSINHIEADFLVHSFEHTYDIVIGNPPFKKLTNTTSLLKVYKQGVYNQQTNNVWAFFIEKALKLGTYVAFISPKSVLSAPEFDKTRELLRDYQFIKINDYGEKGFKGVKIETISFIIKAKPVENGHTVKVVSLITHTTQEKEQEYIFPQEYPYWLLYRNQDFDTVAHKLQFGIFSVFRDRQITKKITQPQGSIRVLKSRNIGSNAIINLKSYDCYINSVENLAVKKFLNYKGAVIIPNLSYYPRATFLPENTITDGSVAILTVKNGIKVTKKDLEYFNTPEFTLFYKIARNLGTRSLNIDANSVYYWGIPKKEV